MVVLRCFESALPSDDQVKKLDFASTKISDLFLLTVSEKFDYMQFFPRVSELTVLSAAPIRNVIGEGSAFRTPSPIKSRRNQGFSNSIGRFVL